MLPERLRRLIEGLLPWYDPADAVMRQHNTEQTRQRSIAARIRAEDVARRYERYDHAVRR